MTQKELAGRVAVVTGAGRNIGRAIALALADAGASIVVNGLSDAKSVDGVVREIEAGGGRALAAMADVTDEAAVLPMIAAAAERFGRIDVIVNNAAGRPEQPFESMSLADWRGVLATILDGAFLVAKAALPHLKRSGAGAIINIGGVSGHIGTKHRAHVVTAKAGLIGLTKAVAHDLAPDGITANCVVPGLIETARDLNARLPHHHSASRTLTGRLGAPGDVAAMVRFLAGPQARYITGQTLHVNGGMYLG
ncbi:MAG TPA: SDR family oxidoreductase [Dongiaceae bacterium]|nr:SDR family oxidoreductase [Dongiaceae bacterium]